MLRNAILWAIGLLVAVTVLWLLLADLALWQTLLLWVALATPMACIVMELARDRLDW